MRKVLSRLLHDHGMLLVLLLLCAYYSFATYGLQSPQGGAAGEEVARQIVRQFGANARVMIAARDTQEDAEFTRTLQEGLTRGGATVVETVQGSPVDARKALERIAAGGQGLTAIAANQATARWGVFDNFGTKFPALSQAVVVAPQSYRWPTFLTEKNLLNVANQIVVIAILAIGMTMVIITGGIDLSVGSLIALSAVVTTLVIREVGGGTAASPAVMLLGALAGIAICALSGLFSGSMVTWFGIPPFIVTLGMMLVGSGVAFIVARGQSIYQIPDSFVWLGRGEDIPRVPNAVLLTAILYATAHALMTRTRLGRHIYAVGGRAEAARLSGVPVRKVLLFVYTASGALAGLGGVVMASQLKSGAPTYGVMYELYVIAAAVVGGTSLQGGQGSIVGTLIGAFIIAVIRNGMNLTNVESYTQNVILGLVILGAVLLDMLKRRNWKLTASP